MNLGRPSNIEVRVNQEKTEFRFRLSFPVEPRLVEFQLSPARAMMISHGLKMLQAHHKIPIPQQLRPSGKPRLRIVRADE